MRDRSPTIASVVTFGRTEWSGEERKSVRAFRGHRDVTVGIKDEQGRPAWRAHRYLVIAVICTDGISYRFTHGSRISADSEPSRSIRVHGIVYGMSRFGEAFPPNVMAAYQRAARRVRACLRIMRAEVAALPEFKPRHVAKVA